jgi:hypothetical protein
VCLPCLTIRLIIQTIRQDPSESVWTDDLSNVSRPDPSATDQIEVEHQASDLVVDSAVPQSDILPDGRCDSAY